MQGGNNMNELFSTLTYAAVCFYVGVTIGTYLKLKKYGVTRNAVKLSLGLFPWILLRNTKFSWNRAQEMRQNPHISIYKRIKFFFVLWKDLLRFAPMFIGVVANMIKKAEYNSPAYIVNLSRFKQTTGGMYNKVFLKHKVKYVG